MCSGLVASLVILASLKIFPTFALVSFGSLSGGLTGLLIGLVINFSNLKERLDLCDHSRLLALFYKREVDLKLQNTYLILLVLLIVCFVLSFSLHPDANWLEDFSLPLSFAIIYLIFGILLGTYGLGLIQLRNHEIFNAELLEKLTEFVVIVSVFSCGLKIVRPLRFKSWQITTRLIVLLMPISIFALAIAGKFFLAMNWGAAILLGAILAPTDPVLASEVQLTDLNDEDELRFALTSEGG
jgi:NhaP-type Na+/H+ or K+/H+ antiporter